LTRKLTLLTVVAALTLLFCATAGATDVLYTTLGPNGEYDTGSGYFVDGSNYFNQVLAFPFMPSQSENMVDAVLALGNYAGSNAPVSLFLASDNAGSPGSILATLSQQGTIPPFPGGLVQFNCSSCGTVNAGTTYWVIAQETDPGTEQAWMFSYQDQQGPGAFNQLGSNSGPWNLFDSTNVGFRVDGAVPEPGTLVMLGSGIVAAAAGLRRKFNV
jgi:PEP-CTERM motif